MDFVNQILGFLDPVIAFFEPAMAVYAGDGENVDWMSLGIHMGIIGAVLALLMRDMGAILVFSVVGMIIHEIIGIVKPMVMGGDAGGFDAAGFFGQFTDMTYLKYLGGLIVGYFVIILVLSIVKGIFFRGD